MNWNLRTTDASSSLPYRDPVVRTRTMGVGVEASITRVWGPEPNPCFVSGADPLGNCD